MLVKPNTALTGGPSGRVMGGRAWKARKMKPEPSTSTRCMSVAAISGPRIQHVDARAIGADDLGLHDTQKDPRVAEAPVAAVAGDHAVVDVDDFVFARTHPGRRIRRGGT